jgi:hypothetical protein
MEEYVTIVFETDDELNPLSSHPKNRLQIKKYIDRYLEQHPGADRRDVIYELAFLKQEHDLKHMTQLLRDQQLGFSHPHFQNISKQIHEMDHFMDKPFEVTEGVNQCGNAKCNGKRTLSYSRQTRGGDEGMTVYVFCVDCKFRYIMNS